MGRKGSKLIPFLIDALNGNKYNNLKFENIFNKTFSLLLPQKSARLDGDCQLVLQDWYGVKGRPYKMKVDYTEAKQGMEAAMRKSDFLELVHKGRNTKLVYKILTSTEVKEKKIIKKAQKKAKKSNLYANSEYAPSPESSGYGSGSDNLDEICEGDGNHALLHALNHDHKYIFEMGHDALIDENVQPMQLGYVEDAKFVTDPPPPPPNEGLFFENGLPFDHLESFVEPGPACQNSFENFNFSILQDDAFPDESDTSPLQDAVTDGEDLNETLILNPEHAKLVDECLKNLEEFLDVEENPMNREISAASGLDIASYKTKVVKVYECVNRQNLPGMIILTCEPKLKEFCVSDTNESEPSTPRLFFDEATMHLMSTCTLENVQFLTNDHVLVFLKCEMSRFI